MKSLLREYHICYVYNNKKLYKDIIATSFHAVLTIFEQSCKYDIIAQISDKSNFSKYK